MRRKPPIVRLCMTRLPVEAEQCETVAEVVRVMQEHGIRHVPVMAGAHLRGIVTQRDILAARIRYQRKLDDMPLEQICQRDVLTVSPVTPIDEVTDRMLARKVGSAVVVDGGFVVGIFTATDALRLIRNLYRPASPSS